MAIYWKLKSYLSSTHNLFSVKDFQIRIQQKTGVRISTQNLGKYLNQKPKNLRLKTMEIICTALECKLTDFCNIGPSNMDPTHVQKLSYKNTPHSKRGKLCFPEPQDYK